MTMVHVQYDGQPVTILAAVADALGLVEDQPVTTMEMVQIAVTQARCLHVLRVMHSMVCN